MDSHVLSAPITESEVRQAIRAHYQENASMTVMNARITLLCALLLLAIFALAAAFYRQSKVITDMRPWIVRINDVGRTDVVSLNQADYSPQAPELKAALRQFVELYYSRVRTTVQDDFARSLHFVETSRAESILEVANREEWISGFISSATPEIQIKVLNVVLTDMSGQPYKALVDFEKQFTQNRQPVKKERWTASFSFYVRPSKDSVQDYVNPLGFTIADFREDKAMGEN